MDTLINVIGYIFLGVIGVIGVLWLAIAGSLSAKQMNDSDKEELRKMNR